MLRLLFYVGYDAAWLYMSINQSSQTKLCDALLPSAASLNNSIIYLSIFKTSLQVLQYIPSLSSHGLSNHKEASELTEAVKQTLYEEYLQAYSEDSRD